MSSETNPERDHSAEPDERDPRGPWVRTLLGWPGWCALTLLMLYPWAERQPMGGLEDVPHGDLVFWWLVSIQILIPATVYVVAESVRTERVRRLRAVGPEWSGWAAWVALGLGVPRAMSSLGLLASPGATAAALGAGAALVLLATRMLARPPAWAHMYTDSLAACALAHACGGIGWWWVFGRAAGFGTAVVSWAVMMLLAHVLLALRTHWPPGRAPGERVGE